VVSAHVPAQTVEDAVREGAGELLEDIQLYDVFTGPQIGEDRKSLAYRVTFTAPDRALTDAELGKVRDRIARTLRQRVGGELRA
jgi:phenylalanyl-tRNA synthetase beta chain